MQVDSGNTHIRVTGCVTDLPGDGRVRNQDGAPEGEAQEEDAGVGDAAIGLWERLSLEEIDGLIHVLNQYRTNPDDRLNDYLQRCADQWAKDNEAKRMAALGIREGITIVERI